MHLEEKTQILPDHETPGDLVHRITLRIRQSLELQEILETTVTEVRSLLGTDRIKIYRFHADGSGEVVAESRAEDRLPALLGLNFPADDIPPYARELFITARQRVAVDVVGQTTTAGTLEEGFSEDIRHRPVDPCHVEYLTAMCVRSSVVVPILHEEKLWGLLVSHHSEQRTVTNEELQFIQAVTNQLEIAIAQAMLLSQMRAQATQEASINELLSVLHRLPNGALQDTVEKIAEIFQASSGRLYLVDDLEQFYLFGEQPQSLVNSDRQIEQHLIWQRYLNAQSKWCNLQASQDTGTEAWSGRSMQSLYLPGGESPDPHSWAINDIYEEPLLRTLIVSFRSTEIRGVLIVPLRYDDRTIGCLTLFRSDIETERAWAHDEEDVRQQLPKMSFEAWRELKRGQAKPWLDSEKKLAQAIAAHLVMAIQQFRLYQQVQSLNTTLESQVQDRTAALQKTLEELKIAQSQLVQTEKMSSLGQLVAGVAHEINNPINFIHGNLEYAVEYTQELLELVMLYQRGYQSDDETLNQRIAAIDLNFLAQDLPDLIQSMKSGTDRIRDIVKSLRIFSRLDESDFKSANLHDGIDSTLMIIDHRLKGQIQIVKEYGELPLVNCYPGQLNQVLMNVISNAIDAIEAREDETEPGSIKIQTSLVDQRWVQIRIADNGMGMREEVRSRLFDPFFTTKPIGKGTGLGLSISYQIVTDKHQGTLTCKSEPGHGAEFMIQIPLHASQDR
jgi:light-regulated signal transduction histidine kinase (bacteriophytochrome)